MRTKRNKILTTVGTMFMGTFFIACGASEDEIKKLATELKELTKKSDKVAAYTNKNVVQTTHYFSGSIVSADDLKWSSEECKVGYKDLEEKYNAVMRKKTDLSHEEQEALGASGALLQGSYDDIKKMAEMFGGKAPSLGDMKSAINKYMPLEKARLAELETAKKSLDEFIDKHKCTSTRT